MTDKKIKKLSMGKDTISSEVEALPVDIDNIEPPDDNIEILGKNQEYSLTMYMPPNADSRYFVKFIKATERMIRGNTDYKLWLTSLRESDEYGYDQFLNNITSDEAEIQLHHFPINLYNICQIVIEKLFDEEKKVSSFIVADEVIRLHLRGIIGLVPLSTTMHEIAHNSELKFLRWQIKGNWETFVNEYEEYLSEYDTAIIKDLLSRTKLEKSQGVLKEITHDSELD